jgi:hypothetical protein
VKESAQNNFFQIKSQFYSERKLLGRKTKARKKKRNIYSNVSDSES